MTEPDNISQEEHGHWEEQVEVAITKTIDIVLKRLYALATRSFSSGDMAREREALDADIARLISLGWKPNAAPLDDESD